MAVMNYKQTNRYPDGTGMLLDTTPGTPDSGSYTTEAQLKQWTNAEIISGSQVVGKAQKDQNGNVIDTTYATKAEVNALSARVSNLEQTTKQDEQTVQYPDDGNYSSLMPNKVPLSVADYAEVPRFRGKTRAWNQLAKQISTQTNNGITCTNNGDGTYTLNGTLEAGQTRAVFVVAEWNTDISALHKYLITDDAPSGASYGFCGGSLYYRNCIYDTVNLGGFNALIIVEANVSNVKITPILRDVTTILSDWSPTDITTANIPLMVQQIPDLLKCDAYDAGSLVDTSVTGVRTTSINIFDEETELGAIDITTGAKIAYSGAIRTKNFVPVEAGQTYYLLNKSMTSGYMLACFYDSLGNFVTNSFSGGYWNNTFVVPSGCSNLLFCFSDSYGTTYKHDTQICLNSCADKTVYHPHILDTLTLSEPVTLRSAGAVSEVLTLETGKKTRPIGSYTFTGDEEWNLYGASFGTNTIDSIVKMPATNSDIANIIGTNFTPASAIDTYTGAVNDSISIANTVGSKLRIYVSNQTTSTIGSYMTGKTIYYELATPLPDEQVCDPIIDNYIAVQANGTINTIQSQSPVIDNCLDVGYLAL